MCIAVYCPANSGIIPFTQIQTMWENNPDGAGIAINHGTYIQILKGFQTPEELFEVTKHITKEMFLHFRIGTHGSKADPKHTHPFPIGANKEQMETLSMFCDSAMMHNGIMYKWGDELSISDSMKFARDFLGALKLEYPSAKSIIEAEIDGFNKVAIMQVGHPTMLCGKGWIKVDGRWYSNEGYLPSRWSVCDPRQWDNSDELGIKYHGYTEPTWYDLYTNGTLESDPEIMSGFFDEVQWVKNCNDWDALMARKRKPKDVVNSDWDVVKTYKAIMANYEVQA